MAFQEYILVGGQEIPLNIVRTGRKKSIAVEISPRCEVLVRAPRHLTDRQLQEKIASCSAWLEKRFDFLKEAGALPGPRILASGARLLFLGEAKELLLQPKAPKQPVAAARGKHLLVRVCPDLPPVKRGEAVRTVVISWYRRHARAIFAERVGYFAPLVGVPLPPIRISNAGKRWGSCGAAGRLNFSWRLAMAPLEIIDYVVVHELCHLKRRDHSPAFWLEVARVMPDHGKRRQYLNRHGAFYDL